MRTSLSPRAAAETVPLLLRPTVHLQTGPYSSLQSSLCVHFRGIEVAAITRRRGQQGSGPVQQVGKVGVAVPSGSVRLFSLLQQIHGVAAERPDPEAMISRAIILGDDPPLHCCRCRRGGTRRAARDEHILYCVLTVGTTAAWSFLADTPAALATPLGLMNRASVP
jgi:hypothetical protein